MSTTTLTLPWPPNTLSPNARHGHWGARARAAKRYRDTCYLCVLEQRAKLPAGTSFDIELRFAPPAGHRYDRDNLVARMKHGLDGVARAWGIDDHQFVRVAGEIADVAPASDNAHVTVQVTARAV